MKNTGSGMSLWKLSWAKINLSYAPLFAAVRSFHFQLIQQI